MVQINIKGKPINLPEVGSKFWGKTLLNAFKEIAAALNTLFLEKSTKEADEVLKGKKTFFTIPVLAAESQSNTDTEDTPFITRQIFDAEITSNVNNLRTVTNNIDTELNNLSVQHSNLIRHIMPTGTIMPMYEKSALQERSYKQYWASWIPSDEDDPDGTKTWLSEKLLQEYSSNLRGQPSRIQGTHSGWYKLSGMWALCIGYFPLPLNFFPSELTYSDESGELSRSKPMPLIIPDLSDAFLMGADNGLATTAGMNSFTLQDENIPNHAHQFDVDYRNKVQTRNTVEQSTGYTDHAKLYTANLSDIHAEISPDESFSDTTWNYSSSNERKYASMGGMHDHTLALGLQRNTYRVGLKNSDQGTKFGGPNRNVTTEALTFPSSGSTYVNPRNKVSYTNTPSGWDSYSSSAYYKSGTRSTTPVSYSYRDSANSNITLHSNIQTSNSQVAAYTRMSRPHQHCIFIPKITDKTAGTYKSNGTVISSASAIDVKAAIKKLQVRYMMLLA